MEENRDLFEQISIMIVQIAELKKEKETVEAALLKISSEMKEAMSFLPSPYKLYEFINCLCPTHLLYFRHFRGSDKKLHGLAFSLSGDIFLTGGSDFLVSVYETATGTRKGTLEPGPQDIIGTLVFSKHGKYVLGACDDGQACPSSALSLFLHPWLNLIRCLVVR